MKWNNNYAYILSMFMLWCFSERETKEMAKKLLWFQDNYDKLSTKYVDLSDQYEECLGELVRM